ncbi:MAG: PASTA domain-containing protein [Planctomycetes bacterium]|nr:PASTA domain-containing protein [Planctomycetota bacterium]
MSLRKTRSPVWMALMLGLGLASGLSAQIAVPDLTGLTVARARDALERLELTGSWHRVTPTDASIDPVGFCSLRVNTQDPAPGTSVDFWTEVRCGLAPLMPDLSGKSLAECRPLVAEIEAFWGEPFQFFRWDAGCTQSPTSQPEAQVREQTPRAGSLVNQRPFQACAVVFGGHLKWWLMGALSALVGIILIRR